MSELWQGLTNGLESVLRFFEGQLDGLLGAFAWGWAIILLTVAVRVVLLPLAIKQTTSMRAMQRLAPDIKKVQAKYKADRGLMKTDPEKFKALRAKQQEEMQGLYRLHGVNPAAGCLPLVAQMPIFFALFTVLRSSDLGELQDAPFYLVEHLSNTASGNGDIGAFLLLILMAATTFLSQQQMMKSNPAMSAQPQQKVMLYIMPPMLAFFGFSLPVGVLLYWVTTNAWTMAQQYVIFRQLGSVEDANPGPPGAGAADRRPASSGGGGGGGKPASAAKATSSGKGVPTPKRAAANGGSATSRVSGQGNGKVTANGKGKNGGGRAARSGASRARRGS